MSSNGFIIAQVEYNDIYIVCYYKLSILLYMFNFLLSCKKRVCCCVHKWNEQKKIIIISPMP